jgi:hypothetical protein
MNIGLFVKNIEDTYHNITIYRSIIVTNDDIETELLYKKLELLNHDPCCIYEDEYDINYNYRLFIINKNLFYKFLEKINKNAFNFVGISFNIIDEELDNIITYISKNTNDINILNINTYNNKIIRD